MFNLSISINAYIIVSICILHTYAMRYSDEDSVNVGSVLFTSSDLNKKRWYRTNIELLQARRYFQNIIPSPKAIDTLSEDYVSKLLKYFADAFITIKREALDPSLAGIMEKALSDTVGGYFKVWLLPVTKFAYYGGTVSQDNAVKAFELYDNLKRSLNTDGSGWRNPSESILNSIAISVLPFSHVPYTRSMNDQEPCEHLAYYEKTPKGLTIPTPCINWDENPCSMFLPLKNESLVQLNSPSSAKALLKYYDIAESCCQSESPEGCSDFDVRFQDWLSKKVVPHLNDDNLYIAFGGLLSLLNKTNELYDKTTDSYEYECDKYTLKTFLSRIPPCMTSRKFLILAIILFIEIIWCVPAVLYIICSRRKPKTKTRTQYFLDVFKRGGNGNKYQTVGRIDKSDGKFINQKDPSNLVIPRIMDNGVRLIQKPWTRNLEIDTQCPSHTSKHSIGQVTEAFSDIINNVHKCNCQSVTLINEKAMKSSLKQKPLDAIHSSHVETTISPISKHISATSQSNNFIDIQSLETTITKMMRDKSESNSKNYIKSSSIADINTNNKVCSEIKQRLQDLYNKEETNDLCPCNCCIEEDRRNMEAICHIKKQITRPRATKVSNDQQGTSRVRKVTDTVRRIKLPKLQPNICNPKNIRLNNSKGLRLNSGEPLLEIRIDKPAAEIIVDVTKYRGKNTKPSKIPRRANNAVVGNSKETYRQKKSNTTPTNKIPYSSEHQNAKPIRNRSIDDCDVITKVVKLKNMNVTL